MQPGTSVIVFDVNETLSDMAPLALGVLKTLATWADSWGNASARGLRQVAGGSACAWLCVG